MPLEFAVFSPDAAFVVTVARDGLVRSWCSAEGVFGQFHGPFVWGLKWGTP